ncbi:MAG TPA: hypothetical protein VGN95_25155 [Pyrinomonadaceae bacterium]|jgi:hypothetical protein|nr:hypothetical protein [Pyrinomonadaceae bacterium]
MKKEKKRAPLKVLQPGERNEFWESILRCRDTGDPRWMNFASAMRISAEAYEKNRDSGKSQAA